MAGEAPREPPDPPELDRLVPELRARAGPAPVLVGTGQFSPWVGHPRVAVVTAALDEPPRELWDGFMPKAMVDELRERLFGWPGELDFMYATAWHYAWTEPPAPFRLLEHERVHAWADAGMLHVREGAELRIVPVAGIAEVRAELSADWSERSVRVRERAGRELVLAWQEEPFALLDPTYDGIDLMCDASWVTQLAWALSRGLGVGYSAHPDL